MLDSNCLLLIVNAGNYANVPAQVARVNVELSKIISLAQELVPQVKDVQVEQIGDMVDAEMLMTSQAIEEATAKIAVGACFLVG